VALKHRVGAGMVASPSEFQTKVLRKSIVPDEYKLYRAALKWDLTDPIVIETRKDLKSQKRWHNQLQPYHHQVANLITFCRRLPVTLLADDVGLGKLRHARDDGPHRELEDIANAVVFLISPESGWITNLHACVRD
jgi:hypothetical protein